MGPLAGLRVIDMTSVVSGPYTTLMLGDYGADVIKIEAPEGDVVRQAGPERHKGMGALFLNANRSKRSITLDLKHRLGQEIVLRLAESADILVYNIRPAAMARLGLAYEPLAARNARLIYAGVFGYGQDGPYAAKPAYDDLIQGAATVPYLFSRAGTPHPLYLPSALADRVAGLFALSAILAAVVERASSGKGQRVDIPMFESMVNFIMSDHLGGLTFEPPLDAGGYARQLSPQRRPYKTLDGYICTLLYTDAHWERFFTAVGQAEKLKQDQRFSSFAARMAHIDEVYATLSDILVHKTTKEWMEILEAADIPVMPMHDFDSLLKDPHLVATNYFASVTHPTEGEIKEISVPTKFFRTPAKSTGPAPQQGQHGYEILQEAGYTEADIDNLAANKAWQKSAQETT